MKNLSCWPHNVFLAIATNTPILVVSNWYLILDYCSYMCQYHKPLCPVGWDWAGEVFCISYMPYLLNNNRQINHTTNVKIKHAMNDPQYVTTWRPAQKKEKVLPIKYQRWLDVVASRAQAEHSHYFSDGLVVMRSFSGVRIWFHAPDQFHFLTLQPLSECDSALTAFVEAHTDVEKFSLRLSVSPPVSFLYLSCSLLTLPSFMPFLFI